MLPGAPSRPSGSWIVAAEHLVAAAEADQLAAVAQVLLIAASQPCARSQARSALHGLGAGQDDQVAGRDRLARPDPAEVDLRVQAQRVEVVVVGDAREDRRDDLAAWPRLCVRP